MDAILFGLFRTRIFTNKHRLKNIFIFSEANKY